MEGERVRTDSYPTHQHRCTARQDIIITMRFRGAARTGLEVCCPHCCTTFVYVRPTATPTGSMEQGGRTHF